MRERMRGWTSAAVAIAALGALAAGCGDDDDNGGNGDGGSATPEAIVACVEDAGLTATTRQADPRIGITGGASITLSGDGQIIVDLFDDSERATEYSDGQAAFLSPTGGKSEVFGETAVIGQRKADEAEVETVKGCLE